MAESAPSAARFRVALSVLGSCLVENCPEGNSHFWAVGRTHGMRPSGLGGTAANGGGQCVRQDKGDGGKLWDAMRRAGSCVTRPGNCFLVRVREGIWDVV